MSVGRADDGEAPRRKNAPPPPLEALSYEVTGRLLGRFSGGTPLDELIAAAPGADWAAVRQNKNGARDALQRFTYDSGETLYSRLLHAGAEQRAPARGRAFACALHALTWLPLAETRDLQGRNALEEALRCDCRGLLPRGASRGWHYPEVQVFAFATARDEGLFWRLACDPPPALVGAPTYAEFYAGGDTALHVAARGLRFELVEALVGVFRLDPAVRNAAGQRAVDALEEARDARRGQPMMNPAFRDAFLRARGCLLPPGARGSVRL